MSDTITYNALEKRAKQSALEWTPDLPTTNTVAAWESFIEELDAIDVFDCAHQEADSWDWVIYYWSAMELCRNVPTSVLHEAESECDDMGMFENVEGLYELACKIAYVIVQREMAEQLEIAISDLRELAENQIENLESV